MVVTLFDSSLYPSPKLFKFLISIQAFQGLVKLFLLSLDISGLPGQVGKIDMIPICSRGFNGRIRCTYPCNNQ